MTHDESLQALIGQLLAMPRTPENLSAVLSTLSGIAESTEFAGFDLIDEVVEFIDNAGHIIDKCVWVGFGDSAAWAQEQRNERDRDDRFADMDRGAD